MRTTLGDLTATRMPGCCRWLDECARGREPQITRGRSRASTCSRSAVLAKALGSDFVTTISSARGRAHGRRRPPPSGSNGVPGVPRCATWITGTCRWRASARSSPSRELCARLWFVWFPKERACSNSRHRRVSGVRIAAPPFQEGVAGRCELWLLDGTTARSRRQRGAGY